MVKRASRRLDQKFVAFETNRPPSACHEDMSLGLRAYMKKSGFQAANAKEDVSHGVYQHVLQRRNRANHAEHELLSKHDTEL